MLRIFKKKKLKLKKGTLDEIYPNRKEALKHHFPFGSLVGKIIVSSKKKIE